MVKKEVREVLEYLLRNGVIPVIRGRNQGMSRMPFSEQLIRVAITPDEKYIAITLNKEYRIVDIAPSFRNYNNVLNYTFDNRDKNNLLSIDSDSRFATLCFNKIYYNLFYDASNLSLEETRRLSKGVDVSLSEFFYR